MLTLQACREKSARLYIGCKCGASRNVQPDQICRAFDGWRIEELQRAGLFSCEGCDRLPAVMVYAWTEAGMVGQVERWA